MASADILRAARARIEDPKNWTQGFFAKDQGGRLVASRDEYAVCWCALGAVIAEADYVEERYSARFLFEASKKLFDEDDVTVVNDYLGHDAVLKIYDAAIAAAEAEAGR
ncbi:hypothetical protein C0214_19495 [Methylobacterium sp. DM1]|nr:hypothetical protein C0214_19495 [Methylobacterium sp. DM1]